MESDEVTDLMQSRLWEPPRLELPKVARKYRNLKGKAKIKARRQLQQFIMREVAKKYGVWKRMKQLIDTPGKSKKRERWRPAFKQVMREAQVVHW